ncbi:MAG: rhodanese-like domain-containing protein [Candidatus Moranbacteria bacterium]|nr:rhodanese-like domain-containing protein [Candidatus Moranbacteria bacterium]
MFQQKNQNKVFILGFVLILAVVVWSLARPLFFKSSQKENPDANVNEEILKAPSITLDDFSKKMKTGENIFLIDLRSPGEFSAGHLAGSVNFPSGTNLASQIGKTGAEKTANVIIMNEGTDVFQTAKAANEVIAAGFVNAKYLRGGLADWRNAGYTLVSEGKSPGDQNKIKKITVEKIASDLSGGDGLIQFIDVRENEQFGSGHIPKAVNLPLSVIEKDQKAISPAKEVIVYGGNEDEANKAAVILFDLNFFNVYVLDGGLDAWKKADGKIE